LERNRLSLGNEKDHEKFKVAIIAPTCFYYQVDLFRELDLHPKIDLKVYFCSDEALDGVDVLRQFNTDRNWGDEKSLLVGYKYQFLKNYSPFPSYLKWPFGLMNFGIWSELRKNKPDAVVLMSWMNPTWWLAIIVCSKYRIPFFYLTDSNVQTEPNKPRLVSWAKQLALGKLLFKAASGFLSAGETNKQMYQYYGVPEEKLIPFAFSWGYQRLRDVADEYKSKKSLLRKELGIPENDFVALYCGRLSHEKSPELLLKAFHGIDRKGKSLIYVGDGALRGPMEEYVKENKVDSVHFFGFQDRVQIPKYYAVAVVLVLPSRREATGGVVNEAMAFGLPVIVSDQVGFGIDFVVHGANGYIFHVGDSDELGKYIQQISDLPDDMKEEMGAKSQKIMDDWLGRDLPGNLVQYLEQMNNNAKGKTGKAGR